MVKDSFSILISLSLLMMLLLTSCQEKTIKKGPENLLSEEQFTDIMEELFLIEGLRSMHTSAEHKQLNPTENYYNGLWEEHKIDKEIFMVSFQYYSKDRKMMERVYAEVAKRLKVKEDRLKSSSDELRPAEREAQSE